MSNTSHRSLGSGLDVLLGHMLEASPVEPTDSPSASGAAVVPIHAITPNPFQPRESFDPDELAALATSIRTQGVIQPLVVRPSGEGQYQLIAGERRLRASQLADLTEVPVVVRAMDDQTALLVAMVENVQRADLNPLEQAQGLQKLADKFQLNHQAIADTVGYSRPQVTNLLRLLTLSDAIKAHLHQGKLDMGHARALLPLDAASQDEVASLVTTQGWSVRETEQAVSRRLLTQVHPKRKASPKPRHTHAHQLAERIASTLKLETTIRPKANGSGQLVIHYQKLKDLEHILHELAQTSHAPETADAG